MAVPNWLGEEIFESQEAEKETKRKRAMHLAEDAETKPLPPKTILDKGEYDEANALFHKVLDWCSKNGVVKLGSQEVLGISYQSIWRWRSGKKPISRLGLEKLRAAIQRIEEIQKQQKAIPQGKSIITTSTVKIISELLAECVENRHKGIYIVNGQSGQGKTTALKWALQNGQYEEYKPGIKRDSSKTQYVLLESNQYARPPAMLKKILKSLGIKHSKNISENIDLAVEFLKENPILIIIDESDWWQRQQWLNALRIIWQGSHTPIFLLGCPRYMEELSRQEDEYRQLNSRVAMKYRFQALSLEEVLPFFLKSKNNWSRETIEEIYALSGGNLHDLLSLMEKTKTVSQINPSVSVSPELIKAVKKQFLS